MTKTAEQYQASPDASLPCKSTKATPEARKRVISWGRKAPFRGLSSWFLAPAPRIVLFPAFDLGVMLFDQGKFQEAIPYFQRATGENPKLAQAYLYLGRSQLSIRRWRDAIQPLRTAYRLAPQETKEEVFNILVDALVAASLDVPGQAPTPRASP